MKRAIIVGLAMLLLSCAGDPRPVTRPRLRPIGLDAEIEQSSRAQIVVANVEDEFASAYVVTDFGMWAIGKRSGKAYRVVE